MNSYDYKFSTTDYSKIGAYRDRANNLVRLLPITHGFNKPFTTYYILSSANEPIGYSNNDATLGRIRIRECVSLLLDYAEQVNDDLNFLEPYMFDLIAMHTSLH